MKYINTYLWWNVTDAVRQISGTYTSDNVSLLLFIQKKFIGVTKVGEEGQTSHERIGALRAQGDAAPLLISVFHLTAGWTRLQQDSESDWHIQQGHQLFPENNMDFVRSLVSI